jgi:cell division protein FtsB
VKKQAAHKKTHQNRFGMVMVGIVVLMLLVVVSIGSYSLRQKLESYQQREAALQEQIAYEHERAKEIESQEKYTQTMKFVEETARKRLGLVYEGEIIFRQGQ